LERGDVTGLAALLAEDAIFAMPPYASWWRGRDVIAASRPSPRIATYRPARKGSQRTPPTGWDPEPRRYFAEALEVLTLEGTRVQETIAFMTPDVFARFGLQDTLSRQ
jgi:hypothetical protein